MGDQRIRPLALALIRRHDEILVERGRDEKKDETFFRPLGGTIEFGERGVEAVRRELREELASEIEVNALVATIENHFTWEGTSGTKSSSSSSARSTTQTSTCLTNGMLTKTRPPER